MSVATKVLIFYTLYCVVHGVQSQAQPCLICGDAVIRLWSMMSRQGDRYLRITDDNDDDNSNHKIVDCGGGLQNDNFTSVLQIREMTTTIHETRIGLVFSRNNKKYHLYAPSVGGQLLAMPASEGEQQTDHRNTWAPERLLYEHSLFTVFQSVKFRGYYLACDGGGKLILQQIINKAYRQPNQLFLTIDPGTAIRGITFGSGNSVGRKKREIAEQEDANPQWKSRFGNRKLNIPKLRFGHYRKQTPYKIWTPRPYYTTTEEPTTRPQPKYSSVVTKFNLPRNITFVLCFWIRSETRYAQLISVTEQKPEKNPKEKIKNVWRRRYNYPYAARTETNDKENNIINVSIIRGMLSLQVGYKRTTRTLPNCDITDGKFHTICISLNHEYLLEVYRDSKVILSDSLPGLACDFQDKNSRATRRGSFMLGQTRGMAGERFDGSLFQVNLWDEYPAFRIKRIATNCGCGGGNLVRWTDLLNATMSNVNMDDNSECPKLEGYNYDELLQSRLI